MQNFLGIKVDTASMTIEELKFSQNKLREEIANTKDKKELFDLKTILGSVNHQILMRTILANRYS